MTPLLYFLLALYLGGLLSALHALFHVRSVAGTLAWVGSLLTIAPLSLPLYWVIGRSRFEGYLPQRSGIDLRTAGRYPEPTGVLERLSGFPVREGHQVRLFDDGAQAFAAMLQDMREAQHSIVIQSFIVSEGAVIRAFTEVLLVRAAAGVDVFVLFDEVGSRKLSGHLLRTLRAGQVRVFGFNAGLSARHRFKLNFRNHRKLLLVDGRVGYTGGLNLGDEYVNPPEQPWRDTHLRIEGPVVGDLLEVFREDWAWATGERPRINTVDSSPVTDEGAVLCMPTGPADSEPTGLLFPLSIIEAAKTRLWLATPYFVPDAAIIAALRLAVLRGVDVRVLLPVKNNHPLVTLASEPSLLELIRSGASVHLYTAGFMHQKVMLADTTLAGIGSHNLDNRSMFLNFELSVVCFEPGLVEEIAGMLRADFARSRPLTSEALLQASMARCLLRRISRLFAPLL